MIHSNQSLLYVSYSWNFRHRLVRLYWYIRLYAGHHWSVAKFTPQIKASNRHEDASGVQDSHLPTLYLCLLFHLFLNNQSTYPQHTAFKCTTGQCPSFFHTHLRKQHQTTMLHETFPRNPRNLSSLKLTKSLHLKIVAWKMKCLVLGWPSFSGYGFREVHSWRLIWEKVSWRFGRPCSFLNGWFVGSILIFQGVYKCPCWG